MRRLEFTQFLDITPCQAWDFFSNPANLRLITPPEMKFRLTSPVPAKIYPGLIITYRVTPLFGIPVNWVTEITNVKEPFYFVDEQRFGPYAIWHHEHHFEAKANGVLMTDRLFYKVPMGFLGNIADQVMVRKKVEAIFRFRSLTLDRTPELLVT